MRTTKRPYLIAYRDGSEELVDATDIADARSEASLLYDQPIRRIMVLSERTGRNPDSEPEAVDE